MTQVTLTLDIAVYFHLSIFCHKFLNIASNKSYKPKQRVWAFHRSRSPVSCDPSLNSARVSEQKFCVKIVTSLQIRELLPKEVLACSYLVQDTKYRKQ